LQWIENKVAVFQLQAFECFATLAAGVARTFQGRLALDESITWAPPPLHSITHDYLFFSKGNNI
jgi:hypothetical protein